MYIGIMTFREKVYEITKQIPKGKVATYGQVARLAGNIRAARAVGGFMRTNPFAPSVPCHRVVGVDGKLTGYSAGKGVESKREILVKEGVLFIKDRVDLTKSLWQKGE
jgi:methylated-DNA-protein-cysteine methyltransferase related protein